VPLLEGGDDLMLRHGVGHDGSDESAVALRHGDNLARDADGARGARVGQFA
jgi:hypothetical protein